MPIDAKILAGVMDMDSTNETIGKAFHRESRNILWRGVPPNVRAEHVVGNILLNNPFLPVIGQNVNLMRWYDSVRQRMFFFNFNSNGAHGIYVFNTQPQTFQRLIEVGINTNGDILKFDANKFVCNVSIIYGDAIQGDILYWLNCQGVPCKLNVTRALSFNAYIIYEESFLDVAKEPPMIPPAVVYEDDVTISVNNLRKKLFKVKSRWCFDDIDKSVTSIQSEIPLPYDAFEPAIDTNPTINCRLAILYSTGPENVKKIEILIAQTEIDPNNASAVEFGDFFLVATLDKKVNSIANNDVAVFNFYNDQAYNDIDIDESEQLFDYVPQAAVSMDIVNGNVPFYSNITEGYPNITDFTNGFTSSNIQSLNTPSYDGRYFSLLVASQSGNSGFGDGSTHTIVKGRVTAGNYYFVVYTDSTIIDYTALPGDGITEVIQGLITDAISNGFTVTGNSGTPDFVYFDKAASILAYAGVTENGLLENIENASDGSLNAYDWWSRLNYGNVYFDKKGRTDGVVYPSSYTVQTIGYQDFLTIANIPRLFAVVYHRPPVWAHYYTWVRTKNLSKSAFIQWISSKTLKDATPSIGESSYAYISLESLNAFKEKNPKSPLSYSFASNDRIRFIKRYNSDNSTASIYTNKDFEIQGQEINPIINGVQQTGQFVKIFLPTTDASFDFGGDAYNYYFIELYTPAQSVSNGLDVYYEFGERYAIGNPTLSTRFHQGQLQNQSADLSIPATFNFIKGDNYSRYRVIQLGAQADYNIAATACMDSDAGRITLGASLIDQTLSDPNIVFGNSPCNNLIGFDLATDTTRDIIQIGTGTFNFRIKGAISIIFPGVGPDEYPYEFFLQKNDGTKYQLVAPFDAHNAGTYTFQFDTTFSMSSGQRIFIFGWSVFGNDNTRTFAETSFSITRTQAFTQTVIDPNFSDYYPSAVNSNGRAWVHEPQAATVTYPVLYRWGLDFQPNTNINRTNRFYPANFDEIDRGRGSIMRIRYYDRTLRFFQERKIGHTGVYQRFITNGDGDSTLITSNDIITKNNVQYFAADFGIGNQPDSLVSDGFRDYFFDPILNRNCRLSQDGIEAISEIFFMQTLFGELGPSYLNSNPYQFGGNARVSGTLNVRPDNTREYLCQMQSSTNGLTGQLIGFNESQKGYTGFMDVDADSIICAENILYSFRQGQLYIHNNTTNYSNFFGTQFYPSLTLIFNDQIAIKKEFDAIAYEGNQIWESPINGDIITSMINSQTGLPQVSQLKIMDYEIQENIRYAAFLRDANSMINSQLALLEGDYLNGTYIKVKFSFLGGNFSWIYAPYVLWQRSNRNF